ncbi:hypothetical protein [Clostridium oceanicum]|uniref:Uncharacterized protein n=1 Tax=Clostridium oceanicum TaxID=1543 RepID=A0ABN1JD82_9CLOT
MENELYNLLKKIHTDFDKRFESLEESNSIIKTQVDKNSLMLEELQANIKIIEKLQTSFSKQLDIFQNKDGQTLGERLGVIELAITNTSKSLNDLTEAIYLVKNAANSNELDIKALKEIANNHYSL